MRVLIVDDSSSVRQKIRKDLKDAQYTVLEADCGQNALDSLAEFQPDVITLDVNMPGMNGFEVATAIRNGKYPGFKKGDPLTNVHIVFITANDTVEERKKGFEAGASDFIMKPFLPGEVESSLQRILFKEHALEGFTALVVDDSPSTSLIVKENLEQQGIKVLTASNGVEAFNYLLDEECTIDLIITDYHMPQLNGLELCKIVRNKMKNTDIPIIFLTVDKDKSARIEIFKAGATDYLVKPFLKEELIARASVHLQVLQQKAILQNTVRELKKSNKCKDDFLAVASHDLRSPLSGILGVAGILSEVPYLKEDEQQLVSLLINSGEVLLSLINEILDIAVLNSESDLNLVDVDFKEIIHASFLTMKPMAALKCITFDFIEENNINTIISGDKNALSRVCNNLLSNAIKFTSINGSIMVYLKREDKDTLVLEITDTGIGIAEEKIQELFDPYTKSSRSGTNNEKGTGLGLSITKKLVERHRGTIGVTSVVDKGTTFRVTFPLVI